MTDNLLTIDEAAARINMSPRYVRRLVAERRIPFHKLGRSVRIAESDLVQLVAAGRVEPLTAPAAWHNLRAVA
ncbi:helix-turn-helix domain-containing protein [Cryptosporangium aurantiacum]|uniref:DNA binding domain-containing protein, excisionase family n=1 Tax=Cryptosporangium aurantiacum TaxID=134849 RepID=A0A1M7RDG8_9ACTN|nr:helix-turn-helix domain-containing protein [Cryptosporangium aurantiacum]SHN44088.1 DNA binding domain-containing protein, excisionase family [Cryptosporangium aurantiacum]